MALTGEWEQVLKPEFEKAYYKKLYLFLKKEYKNTTVYPPSSELFSALNHTPLSKVKVVILGQDPYHEPNQACGFSFSVKKGVPIPPSLQNIYKEIEDDLGVPAPNHGDLVSWADQGVLLLNTVLTVKAHQANSHRGLGWEYFTDRIIEIVNEKKEPVVFLLWGKNAKEKKIFLNNPNHLVLTAPHPSPLSAYRGFFGCKHFSKTNEFLTNKGLEPIDWKVK